MYIFFVLLFLSLLCVKLILDVDIFTPSILSEEKKNRHENRNCMKSKTDKDKQSIFLNCLGKFPPLRRHHLKKKNYSFSVMNNGICLSHPQGSYARPLPCSVSPLQCCFPKLEKHGGLCTQEPTWLLLPLLCLGTLIATTHGNVLHLGDEMLVLENSMQ